MRFQFLLILLFIFSFSCNNSQNFQNIENLVISKSFEYAMVIHGGAGVIKRENLSADLESAYRTILNEALSLGDSILSNGGESEEAVIAVIALMENSPLFNAGRGSVFTHEEKNEMDASIMMGKDQSAGAVAGITNVKNPIKAAYSVLKESDHVLLVGAGAEKFARINGCEIVDPAYFATSRRLESLRKIKSQEDSGMFIKDQNHKFGTVGCVALDKLGNITAGTSTGGMTNKKYNRVGDSPIIGAGTYADNSTCGISSTGHGEYFMRYAVAYDIAARMDYKKISLDEAAKEVIEDKLVEKGGSGGIVGLDARGNITMRFNTEGMYRGFVRGDQRLVEIFGYEEERK